MGTWPRHIDRFKRQYDRAFMEEAFFGVDFMYRIHKNVQVFLHSCNTTGIEYVVLGALAECEGLQKKVERGEWLNLTPG